MGEAGYKQPSGKWLARPSRPLANFKRQEQGQGVGERGEGRDASILFVRESKLLEVRAYRSIARSVVALG